MEKVFDEGVDVECDFEGDFLQLVLCWKASYQASSNLLVEPEVSE